eukprot:m51a1_g199 putative dynamin like protein (675) ;mRNA; f:656772-659307
MSHDRSGSSSSPASTVVDRALPVEVYDAYNSIATLARSINVPVQAPEVVFIGKKGTGKSVLIEAFLGHRFFDTSSTLRPVQVRMVNDAAADTPVVTVLADAVSGLAEEADVPLAKVPDALKERNTQRSSAPIRVVYRHRHTWDLTVVDTPGLLARGDDAEEMRAVEAAVLAAAQRSAVIVAVEEANEWDRACEAIDFARRVDPKLERSVFVFNKFHPFLKNFAGARELRQYLAACPMGSTSNRVFFTTSPGESGRPDNPALYKRRLAALLKADLEALEALQYDRKFEPNIGAAAVQRCVLDLTWRRYQALISEILRRLRELNKQAVDGRTSTAAQLESLSPGDLRQRASTHASALLRASSDLLLGSLEGRPAQHGQTLAEERAAATELGDWVDSRHERIAFNASAAGVPSWDCRLYGAQQFERLLCEFRAVASASARAEITQDEIATALGVGKADVAPNIAWAAADIAQAKSRTSLAPLVLQLIERAKYVAKRLVDIAESVVARASKSQKDAQLISPFFTAHVKDLYSGFVDELAETCLRKCMDEFYCTRLVYWDINSSQSDLLDRFKTGVSADESVRSLAEALFDSIRRRVVENVVLRCYEGLLVPLQSQVAVQIHGRIAVLSDAELDELFELESTKAVLRAQQQYWEQIHTKYQEQEAAFLKAAVAFTHHTV